MKEKHLIELTEKKYVQLSKKRDELWKREQSLPFRKLDNPYQDGWTLNIELIDEALRRKDANTMEQALLLCRNKRTCISRDSKRISQVRKTPMYLDVRPLFTSKHTLWNGTTATHYNGPEILPIKEKMYDKLDPSVKKWFSRREHTTVIKWSGQTVTNVDYILNIREHYFCVKVKKRMVTQVQDIDPLLKKEQKEVDDALEPYYRTAPGHSNWRYDEHQGAKVTRRHTHDALQKLKKGEIEEISQYSKMGKRKK